MGIPLAALGVRTPQFKSPLDQMTKAVHLKSLLQGQQAGQLKLEQQQQAQKDQQIFRKAYMEAQGDPRKTIELVTRAGVSPQLISQYRDSITKSRKALEDLDGAALDNAAKRNDAIGGAFQAVLGVSEQQRTQAYAQVRGQLIQSGVIRAQEAPEQYPGDEFMRVGALSSTSAKDQIAAERQRRVDKETRRHQREMEKPASEREFQAVYPAWLEAKGLKKNGKVEIQARKEIAAWGKKATTPFAAFASGDPKQQRLARQWIGLQEKYRQATGEEKRQLDSINARFKREMEVIKAQIGFPGDPTKEQAARMEELLRKANEDYDAVLSGKAPEQGKLADTVSVISPDGVRGKIPRAQLQDAIKQGYRKVE
ncbi:hypothetical protein LCGC14_0466600 [marine sediment metagenome]|uniref:Uncharacterized protein n=1 Tax=marine sediment metagenome TaxID=412755 RepID=A0A0F9SDF0_9ZZZZ